MDALELSAVVYAPRDEAFEFLLDVANYGRYSEYVADVTQRGDGSVGTRFDITLQWWTLSYTLRTAVTDLDRPNRIDWRVPDDVRAHGYWAVEEVDAGDSASSAAGDSGVASDGGPASRIRLRVEFDRDRSSARGLQLPPLVSTDWLLRRVKPVAKREAKQVLSRAVADLEGQRRPVELAVHVRPTTL
ncbi:SRPBCC family protein [Haloarchaeobius sp. HRN-SO-5]|uniref:SRPBCC family protein n=1 Tax=Haloarchaeobius sp. HRN-SO-5 TaxID=3446118 RepID=UPI003EBED622